MPLEKKKKIKLTIFAPLYYNFRSLRPKCDKSILFSLKCEEKNLL